jgi:hypothetical protein
MESARASEVLRKAREEANEAVAAKKREFDKLLRELEDFHNAVIRENHAEQYATIDRVNQELASRMPDIYKEGDLIVEFARRKEGAKSFNLRYWSVRGIGRVKRSQWSDTSHNAVTLRAVKSSGELGERRGTARWDLSVDNVEGSGGLNPCFAVFRLIDGVATCVYQELTGVEHYYPRQTPRYSSAPPLTEKEVATFRAKAEAILADTAAITKIFPKD